MDVVYGGHGTTKRENMAEAAFTGTGNTTGAANTTDGRDMTGVSAVNNKQYESRALLPSPRLLL